MFTDYDTIQTDWGNEFITDLAGWETGSRAERVRLLADDWTVAYAGDGPLSPLDRHPVRTWLSAFLQVGYFEVTIHLEQETQQKIYRRMVVEPATEPPTETPDLYRFSTPKNARRWSWVSDPSPVVFYALESPEMRVYRARNPIQVLGRINFAHHTLPGSMLQMIDYTEWIVLPGVDVRHMPISENPGGTNWYLREGQAV